MAERMRDNKDQFELIPFRMHPRVFASLGADLVTSDVVAIIELVKNSYDAFARSVHIRFRNSSAQGPYLEIEDDGDGMTRDTIENVWCLVATPNKELNPVVTSGKKRRRVAGEKGLGRLSAARLGEQLYMLTKVSGGRCWEVRVNWSEISKGDELANSFAMCREFSGKPPFRSGTLVRVFGLATQWDENRVSDLRENLARLISPFSGLHDFNILVSGFDETGAEGVEIESPEFLSHPKYSLRGRADARGNIVGTYRFAAVVEDGCRERDITLTWEGIYDVIQDRTQFRYSPARAHCGSFSFELRAWDIGSEDTEEIAGRFDFRKSEIRKAIRAHKGISVYRDGILVLPKTDQGRDWLGLDLRRVSKVGTRLSTSQIVGYVSITAKDNPAIKDTSDRERLGSCLEEAEFEEILKVVVALLENERDEDRVKPTPERPMGDLFDEVSAESLVEEVVALADEGAAASEAVPLLRAFSSSLAVARKTIQERFVYYSRLATVGTIAHMLVHEIRGRTTAFGSFLELVKDRFGPFRDKYMDEEYRCAENAVNALERLADTFAPLASRGFRRRRRQSILEERIRECLSLHEPEIKRRHVQCTVPKSETAVAVDPGELDAIILNLVTNAVYWLSEVPTKERRLEFNVRPAREEGRVSVSVYNTGPGISHEDIDKVFWPGMTRKPGGIGMGLTVASELVAAYGGHMSTVYEGTSVGASFAFDLPLRKQP